MPGPLIYKFKKEKLESGEFISRPKIEVSFEGPKATMKFAALLDSGADTTVVPEVIAKFLGMKFDRTQTVPLKGHHESCEVSQSECDIVFKARRTSARVSRVPVLVVLKKPDEEEEPEPVLGVAGIFDRFNVDFSKSKNRIVLRQVNPRQ